jgi:hypothetical protein
LIRVVRFFEVIPNKALIIVLPSTLILAAGCSRGVGYKKDVKPILDANCLPCHVPGTEGYQKSGLNTVDYDSLMKGTKFGPIIKPGFSVSSTLIMLAGRQAHSSINMPKGKPSITDVEIGTLRVWVDQGAKDN